MSSSMLYTAEGMNTVDSVCWKKLNTHIQSVCTVIQECKQNNIITIFANRFGTFFWSTRDKKEFVMFGPLKCGKCLVI